MPTAASGEVIFATGEWYCFAVLFADASVIVLRTVFLLNPPLTEVDLRINLPKGGNAHRG